MMCSWNPSKNAFPGKSVSCYAVVDDIFFITGSTRKKQRQLCIWEQEGNQMFWCTRDLWRLAIILRHNFGGASYLPLQHRRMYGCKGASNLLHGKWAQHSAAQFSSIVNHPSSYFWFKKSSVLPLFSGRSTSVNHTAEKTSKGHLMLHQVFAIIVSSKLTVKVEI